MCVEKKEKSNNLKLTAKFNCNIVKNCVMIASSSDPGNVKNCRLFVYLVTLDMSLFVYLITLDMSFPHVDQTVQMYTAWV